MNVLLVVTTVLVFNGQMVESETREVGSMAACQRHAARMNGNLTVEPRSGGKLMVARVRATCHDVRPSVKGKA